MHAKQIVEIVAGLKGQQAFRRANMSKLGAMHHAASPSLFVTQEGETGKRSMCGQRVKWCECALRPHWDSATGCKEA